MEDDEAATEQMTKTRIFVGGLAETVTADDLQRIFVSLGAVKGIEVVRTKGRSFAYVDFSPSSLKSLSKLFSAVRLLSSLYSTILHVFQIL
jgi:RNA recognition motif-containing protein